MSSEEVKEAVRRFADESHPTWKRATLIIREDDGTVLEMGLIPTSREAARREDSSAQEAPLESSHRTVR